MYRYETNLHHCLGFAALPVSCARGYLLVSGACWVPRILGIQLYSSSPFEIDGAPSCEYDIYAMIRVPLYMCGAKSDGTSTRTNTAADRRAQAAVANQSISQTGASGATVNSSGHIS